VSYLFVIALLGGAASVLTPCVLPLLPAILAVSAGEGRRRVWGIVAGIELSFFLIAILLAKAISSLGLPPDILRWVAAALLAAFGLVLIVPKLEDAFARATSRLTARLPQRNITGSGFGAGFASGLPLGLVWAPCAGPILAGITVAASTSRFSSRTVLTMFGYALGMIGPLAAVIFGGRKLSLRLRTALGGGRRVLLPMGLVLVATAALIAFGGLNALNNLIANKINLTSTPTAALERKALSSRTSAKPASMRVSRSELEANGYPAADVLKDLGTAPEVAGISHWFNTDGRKLSIESLRGKVVLVDFWTYSCINCIRTLPHLRALYARYAKDGLVILGVHTPEFEFEKDAGNVGTAVKDFHIAYPVALDPSYATWNNYYNHYWPAHYLIDRNGVIRSVHYGEGAYVETERNVRRLLGLKGPTSGHDHDVIEANTPETYLGYGRAERFQNRDSGAPRLIHDQQADYVAPGNLGPDIWTYTGSWTVGEESAVAGRDAHIDLHFRSRKVFIVAGGKGTIRASGVNGAKDVVVDGDRLYTVRSGSYADDVIRLGVSSGVSVYAFTFG
jgi:cytochrome c biogenesis protein CcdA/thiol-disulfide isomerase/thioredoxin